MMAFSNVARCLVAATCIFAYAVMGWSEDEISGDDTPAVDFSRMMREVEALRRYSDDEADSALGDMARSRQKLTARVTDLRQRREALVKEVDRLQKRYTIQVDRLRELDMLERADSASRKALEGATRLTAAAIRDRLAKSVYTSREPAMAEKVNAIASTAAFPAIGDITSLTEILFKELRYSESVSITSGPITLPDGTVVQVPVLRVGGLLAAAHLSNGEHLFAQPVGGGRRLVTVQAEIPSHAIAMLEHSFTPGASQFPADFSNGNVYRRFVGKKSYIQHVQDGGVLIWPIVLLGVLAFLIGAYRYLRLRWTRFGNARVLDRFFALVRQCRLDEARGVLADQRSRNVPVYKVLGHMLDEWGKTDIVSMEKCRDEAVMTQLGPLERGISFIAVAAAVAPLLGLLGTVTGMISTFDIITLFGNSDPKLLSGGISVALVTTELGLIVAIPLMFLHFILSRRVAVLADDMEEKGAVLVARFSAGGGAGGGK